MEKKPVHKITLYPVTAAIWRNSGEKGAFYSATFQRTYKDSAGKYQNSDSFTASELLLLAKLADQTHTEIERFRANDREAAQQTEPTQ